jgi:hypothetical protein
VWVELRRKSRTVQCTLTCLTARPLRRRLMELDEVAGGVAQERLAAAAHGNRIAHVDAPAPQLVDGSVEVVDEQGEVLAPGRGRRRVDEVNLLGAGIEPGTADAKVRGAVLALRQPEDADVERESGVDVVDVDGDVVDGEGTHPTSLAPPATARRPAIPTGS